MLAHLGFLVDFCRGERAFCSAECRSRHIAKEERRDMGILVRKRRDAFHSRHAAPAKTGGVVESPALETTDRCMMNKIHIYFC
jgi:hypothetical protein